MNRWEVVAKPKGSGFRAVIYRADMAEGYFLATVGGRHDVFLTELEAEHAGMRHLIQLWNSEPRFHMTAGPVPHAIALEEKAFGTVTSKRGKKTSVQRRRQRKVAKDKAVAQAALSGQQRIVQ